MPLPSGTLTLLFTDIEGSTRLLDRLGDRYAEVLAAHHAIVRAALAAHGGHEVGTEGDAFFVVFERPRDAVAAAAEVQHRLAEHDWPEGESVRVRMGMHTGAPMVADGNYLGMVVHVAARICAAAHGAQVLLSEATVALLDRGLPDGAGLRELGEHALKDIARPVGLYQLLLVGLPDRFPPLRAQRDAPTNIPLADTPVIGREAELAATEVALREGRLVTLTGAGGTGKTRLAVEAARRMLSELPGGAFLVDLVPVADATGILAAAAEALGLAEAPGRTLEDALFDQLRDRPALLVLDNLEHLDGAAAPVASLLAACPAVTILATSRAPLRLRAERELHVPPLGRAAAVELFIERARAVAPELEPDGAVEEICARLDRLPLAIELAAARVRVLPPPALLQRLERRLPLLTRGAADLPERQRTLAATIAWSYDLLPAAEQRFFAALGAFPGGWTFEAAEAAWGDEPELDVLDGLESLVEKSLLHPPAARESIPLYAMLDTVREFALARLDESGAADGVRRRLAEYHARLADAALRGIIADGLERWGPRLGAELDGIRATMSWAPAALRLRIAGGLAEYMESCGAIREGLRWARDALGDAPVEPSSERARALTSSCYLAMIRGEPDFGAAAELEAMLDQIADGFVRVLALSLLGSMVEETGDAARGEALLRRAADEAGEWEPLRCVALQNLGCIAMDAGRIDEARALLEESIALHRASGLPDSAARFVEVNRAAVALAAGDADDAERRYREVAAHTPRGDLATASFALEGLAWCRAAKDRAEDAARLLAAAEQERISTGRTLSGFEADMHAAAVARARNALGDERLEALWREGRALPLEDALAYALGTQTTPALAAAL